MTRLSLSVVIITRNHRKNVIDCLDAIKKQTLQPDEIVIVEDCTEHQYFNKKILGTLYSGNVIISYKKVIRGNYAKSWNKGIKLASSDLCIFLDDDSFLDPNFIKISLNLTMKYSSALGFVGQVLPSNENYFARFGSQYLMDEYRSVDTIKPIKIFASSGTVLYRSRIIKNHLFLNEKLESNQDIDFCLRVMVKKLRVYYSPKLISRNTFQQNIQDFFQAHLRYGKGFGTIELTHCGNFVEENYLPHSFFQWVIIPFFIFIQLFILSIKDMNRLKSSYMQMPLWLLHHLCIYIGLLSTSDGKTLFRRNFAQKVR